MIRVDVAGIGTPFFDYNIVIDEMPMPDSKQSIRSFSQQGGNKVPTALVAVARLGGSAGLIGQVGDDHHGRFCLEDLAYNGVDASRMRTVAGGATPYCVCLSDLKTRGRAFLVHRKPFEPLALDEEDRRYIRSARYLHLSSADDVPWQAIEWAREAGVRVAYDADGYRDTLPALIPKLDVLIMSEFVYAKLFDDEQYERNCFALAKKGPSIVFVTLGARGSAGVMDGQFVQQPAFTNVDVVDTTGAGDVYHGAFLYGLLQGWDGARIARFSSAVSAIKCTRVGGRAGIPTRAMVDEFLERGTFDPTQIDERVRHYRQS
jgi:sulfofructose kinase